MLSIVFIDLGQKNESSAKGLEVKTFSLWARTSWRCEREDYNVPFFIYKGELYTFDYGML